MGSPPPARTRRRGSAGLVAAAFIVVAVAACSTTVPSPSVVPSTTPPSGPATLSPEAAATYRTIADQVSVIRGLSAPDRVEPVVIDAATLKANLAAEFDASNPSADIARSERVLKLLGLLGPGVSLEQVYLELQDSQVIGYYDPKVKELFLVSRDGALGAVEEVTYAHEFTHELQDRRFDLASIGLDTIKDDSDRALALLALVEGDAVATQTAWMTANLTAAQLGEVVAESSDPAMLAVLARTPRILLETSLFPYQAGATFVGSLQAQGGYATVDAAYANLPVSTEQILHPSASAAGLKPIPVAMPAGLLPALGSGWAIATSDTLGELETRVWLREGGVTGDVARIAAEGWGGDRLALLEGPSGAGAIAWATAWDTVADAGEFEAAARTAIDGLHLDATVARSGAKVAIVIRSAASPGAAVVGDVLGLLTAP